MNIQNPCSCGEQSTHTVARRRTADNVSVLAQSDGTIGSRFQLCHRSTLAPEVLWAVMGEVELFDFSDVLPLINAARVLHRRGKLTPGALRAKVSLRCAS